MKRDSEIVPKYLQICQEIAESIRRGKLKPGERAPSENDIIMAHAVSNTTARRALHELERSGWVTRIKAKGTFVRENRIGRSVDRILGFTRNMMEAGRTPSTKVLGVSVRKTGQTLQLSGRKYSMPGPVCLLERLRLADGVPIMKEKRYVSLQLCPGIENMPLEQSLYDIYEGFGHELTEIHQSLSAVMLERKQDLDLFELEDVVPAFLVSGATFCGKELILEVEESLYRGDLYSFTVKAIR